MLYHTYSTTRNYSPREEFAMTRMSMKYKGILLINQQVAHISFRYIIICVFIRRNNKLESKAHIEFSVIYSQL